MKKCHLALLLSLLLSGSFGHAIARQREEAFALLNSIGRRNFQATFMYGSQPPQGQLGETVKGQIAVQGNQYRLAIDGQEIISDGQTVWTYFTEANEVQVTDYDPEQESTIPWTIFVNPKKNYEPSRFDTLEKNGCTYDSIELIAKNEDNPLLRVSITVEHDTKRIKYVEVVDNNQILYTFFVTYFEYDLQFSKKFFSFNSDEYKKIEIIDMR